MIALIALAGGLGAAARFLLDTLVRSRFRPAFPLGTVVVNVTGSFVLGLVTGLALARAIPDAAAVVAGTGFLGGYTTFSTSSVETVRLLGDRRRRAAALNAVGTLLVAVSAAALGLALGLLAGG